MEIITASKELAETLEAAFTAIAIVVGGIWAYRRFVREEEDYPHIEFSADVVFVSKKSGWWIVELVAVIENKGRVQHRVRDFKFDLAALEETDPVDVSSEWGGQVHFPREVVRGSFLPERFRFFFIDPGVKAKYSFVARVPESAAVLLLHTTFEYADGRGYAHTAERSVAVPKEEEANKAPEPTPPSVTPRAFERISK